MVRLADCGQSHGNETSEGISAAGFQRLRKLKGIRKRYEQAGFGIINPIF